MTSGGRTRGSDRGPDHARVLELPARRAHERQTWGCAERAALEARRGRWGGRCMAGRQRGARSTAAVRSPSARTRQDHRSVGAINHRVAPSADYRHGARRTGAPCQRRRCIPPTGVAEWVAPSAMHCSAKRGATATRAPRCGPPTRTTGLAASTSRCGLRADGPDQDARLEWARGAIRRRS